MDEKRVQRKPTLSDARSYINSVKETFHDEPTKYIEFLMILVAHRVGRANGDTVGIMMTKITQLFEGHQQLILGLKNFSPHSLMILLEPEDEIPSEMKAIEYEDGIIFLDKVKRRFQDDGRVYKSFLTILSLYRKGSKSYFEVFEEVSILLRDHADSLAGFSQFIPGLEL